MKSLVYGCAAAALLMGLAVQAQAEIAVRDAPVHTVPADEDDAPDAAPAPKPDVAAAPKADPAPAAQAVPVPPPAPAKPEPAAVQALTRPQAPKAALTAQENAFFAVLGQRVTDAASAYESYVRRAGAIDPAFSGAASVQHAVKAGAGYHPVQLEEGIIAYAALIALRNQDFVDGVRAIDNPAFADGLAAHPEQVMQVRGARAAAADVAGVLQAQGDHLIAEGKAITKAAYDIQAQAWSKSPVADPKGVLARAEASAEELRVATTPSKEKLLDSLVSATDAPAARPAPGSAPDVERGLALAALAILGKTGDGAEARYEALLHDSSSAECLKMAKLNLNQCLAVAGPHYEDVYCAGRHAVSDTGKCIADAAAGSDDAAPAPRLQKAEAPRAEVIGPEQAAAYGKAPTAPPEDAADDDQPALAAPALAAAPPSSPVAPPPPAAVAAAAPPPVVAAARPPSPAPQYAEARPYAEPPAEPMPDPRLPRQAAPAPAPAPAYAPPARTYSYAQNDYPAPQPPPPQYGRQAYAQPQYPPAGYQQTYPQGQYAPPAYQQPYPSRSYGSQGYASGSYGGQAYPQGQAYAPSYGAQQPYYPQGYPAYQGDYYGR